jgi:hypothetical protein
VDNARFYQPYNAKLSPYGIGTEIGDPVFASTTQGCPPGRPCQTCPSGRVCRFSDALFAQGAQTERSEVARTTVEGTSGSGSLTIGTRVPVSGRINSAEVGAVLRKTGRSTGTTVGSVTFTCQRADLQNLNKTLLCQDFVDAASQAGDSSSPVWFLTASGTALMTGILYGANCQAPNICTRYGYSTLPDIEMELGSLSLVVP